MDKYLSDIDNMTDGTFGIEWEYEDGHRVWETFATETERDKALAKYQESNAPRYGMGGLS